MEKFFMPLLVALILPYVACLAWLALCALRRRHVRINPWGENVLVVVAHPDDEIAVAGAYCIENLRRGGRVRVVFTTTGARAGDMAMAATRINEARRAWQMAGLQPPMLETLGYADLHGLATRTEVHAAVGRLAEIIVEFRPHTIFTSLYENGHFQHDITNYIVGKARDLAGSTALVYEAAQYNHCYRPRSSPLKLLQAALRLLPKCELYHAPPEFIDDRPIHEFPLGKDERALKRRMMSQYESQAVPWLIQRFTLRERFQVYHGYDYSKPPYPYRESLAAPISWLELRRVPVASHYIRKLFGDFRCIHPDPAIQYASYGLDFLFGDTIQGAAPLHGVRDQSPPAAARASGVFATAGPQYWRPGVSKPEAT